MALSADQRTQLVSHLTTNCPCWQGEGDAELLSGLPDEKLLALKADADERTAALGVANAAARGFATPDGRAFRVNPETGKWESRVVDNKKMTAKKIAHGPDDEDEEDEEDEPMPEKKKPAYNADDFRPRKPRTEEEFFASLPEHWQQTLTAAKAVENRAKEEKVARLLANVADVNRPAERERLMRRSLAELEADVQLLPPSLPPEEPRPFGVANRRRGKADDDVLPLPVDNWQEVGKQPQPRTASAEADPGDDEEAWLATAPAAARAEIMNARAINARERQSLIAEIVANLDEDEAARLGARLAHKSVDELRDYLLLSNQSKPAKPVNYFGSAPLPPRPLLPPQKGGGSDDVLPLPKIDWSKAN